MRISIISDDNIREYMRLLTNDEIYGITDGRYTSFAIHENDMETAGIMTVQILPEYIRLERIFILPEYRRRGLASALLEVIKERPEDMRLPIRAFIEDEADVRGLLEASGFIRQESSYSIIEGRLGDWIDLGPRMKKIIPDDVKKKIMIRRLNQISERQLRDFVLRSPHDEILQFPDSMTDPGRFSDISMICTVDNIVKAASLIEEKEDHVQFTWCYGKDKYAVFASMFMVKKELESEEEYGPSLRIRCLCTGKNIEEGYQKIFSEYETRIIYMYQFD